MASPARGSRVDRPAHGVRIAGVGAARDVDGRDEGKHAELARDGPSTVAASPTSALRSMRTEVSRAWQKSGGQKKRAPRNRDALLPAARLPSTITAPLP